MASRTARVSHAIRQKPQIKFNGDRDFILPNTSGDHVRGLKRDLPVNDTDLVNKAYVDNLSSGTFLSLTDTPASYTLGSIFFASAAAVTEDNANFFWHDSRNNLGIGHTNPLSKLHIKGTGGGLDGATVTITNSADDTNSMTFGVDGSGDMFIALTHSSVGVVRISADQATYFNGGDVGIGTATPATKFEVVGITTLGDGALLKTDAAPTTDPMIANKKYVDDQVVAVIGSVDINMSDGVGDSPKICWTPATGTQYCFYVDDASDDFQLECNTVSADTFDIDNVGAGSLNVDIKSGGVTTGGVSKFNFDLRMVDGSGNSAQIDFEGDTTPKWSLFNQATSANFQITASSSSEEIINCINGSFGTVSMTVQGRLAAGTQTLTETLTVNGNVSVTGDTLTSVSGRHSIHFIGRAMTGTVASGHLTPTVARVASQHQQWYEIPIPHQSMGRLVRLRAGTFYFALGASLEITENQLYVHDISAQTFTDIDLDTTAITTGTSHTFSSLPRTFTANERLFVRMEFEGDASVATEFHGFVFTWDTGL